MTEDRRAGLDYHARIAGTACSGVRAAAGWQTTRRPINAKPHTCTSSNEAMGLPPQSRMRRRGLAARSSGSPRSWLWFRRSSCSAGQPLRAVWVGWGVQQAGRLGRLGTRPPPRQRRVWQQQRGRAGPARACLSAAPSSATLLWLIDSFSSLGPATQEPSAATALWLSTSVFSSRHLSMPAHAAGAGERWQTDASTPAALGLRLRRACCQHGEAGRRAGRRAGGRTSHQADGVVVEDEGLERAQAPHRHLAAQLVAPQVQHLRAAEQLSGWLSAVLTSAAEQQLCGLGCSEKPSTQLSNALHMWQQPAPAPPAAPGPAAPRPTLRRCPPPTASAARCWRPARPATSAGSWTHPGGQGSCTPPGQRPAAWSVRQGRCARALTRRAGGGRQRRQAATAAVADERDGRVGRFMKYRLICSRCQRCPMTR